MTRNWKLGERPVSLQFFWAVEFFGPQPNPELEWSGMTCVAFAVPTCLQTSKLFM